MKHNPKKDKTQTVIKSKNPIESISLSPSTRPRIDRIIIDMTGWGNGVREDTPPSNPDVHPYTVSFWDAKGVHQEFTTDTVNSNAMRDILDTLRKNMGAFVTMETNIEIITPRDCLGNHTKPGALPYGCTCKHGIPEFNRYGIDLMPYGVTYQGPAGARLESVLDEICHQYATVSRAEAHRAVHRGARFEASVYKHYDKDQKNAQVFQKYLDSLPKDNMGVPMTGVPYGVEPELDNLVL